MKEIRPCLFNHVKRMILNQLLIETFASVTLSKNIDIAPWKSKTNKIVPLQLEKTQKNSNNNNKRNSNKSSTNNKLTKATSKVGEIILRDHCAESTH